MQAQQTRSTTQSINQTQSLAAVQTLLRAGLGAITFLRNLLPEDNFTQSHFTTIDETSGSVSDVSLSQPSASQESTSSRRNVNSFRIMTITRGYTDEADKILNYLEYGIFDALEKQYLRSFIFAIYLDNKDPTNIVEAYTFNFKYHTLPGTNITIPVMNLVGGKNLRSKKDGTAEDPVAKAIRNGKAPTLKDVKLSVKAMLKTLIQAMNHMDVLPRHRYATFKVFYTDSTPLDYEPPNFQAGDADKDKWYFMTHDLDEIPERCSIGQINTGHHSVKLSVTSIASYLPSSTEHDDATFLGTTTNGGRPNLIPIEEAAVCKNQIEKQLEDAENRNLLWPVDDTAELCDEDAEGEDDPDYIKGPDGQYVLIDTITPIGFRTPSGHIEAVPARDEEENVQPNNNMPPIPQNLHDVVAREIPKVSNIEETQPLLQTPMAKGLRSPSSGDLSSLTSLSTAPTTPVMDFDPEMLKNMTIGVEVEEDAEMLDLETQIEPELTALINSSPKAPSRRSASIRTDVEQGEIQCHCGIAVEDICCFCEGGCRTWYHVWCMGYHDADDPNMPPQFVCFNCRARADITWDLIKFDIFPRMLSKFKDLALFRRAIKVAHKMNKFTSLEFSKEFGGDVILSAQMIRRLEEEEFILIESTSLDDMGFTVTSHSKKGRNKGKGTTKNAKQRKNMQKTRYIFNREMVSKTQYLDYFKPHDEEVEKRMLGVQEITELNKTLRRAQADSNPVEETQTQEESQAMTDTDGRHSTLKRPAPGIVAQDMLPPKKKVKMSLAIGVDLAE
ncbi:DNA-binding protein [Agrocybe pediades]|nr:DNA-binding protein [Agrocybe pediades]